MSASSWLRLRTQEQLIHTLLQQVSRQEAFILLSGERGSGRTAVLEALVNAAERHMRAVYLPCSGDMTLQRLRETFLKQLLPGAECDTSLNLADSLVKHPVPGKKRILVIADDADAAVASFYTELCALYQEFAGQNRFAFVLSGQPLWAEQKQRLPQAFEITEISVPPLTGEEAMAVVRQVCAHNGLSHVYNIKESSLPAALTRCQGRIGSILAYTEQIMAEQSKNQTAESNKNTAAAAAPGASKPQKRSSAGIFITIVCIIIVLGCLAALFVGGNFFKDNDPADLRAAGASTAAESAADSSSTLSGALIDDGALNSPIPEGIEAQTPPAATNRSITLSGKELDKIEEAGSNRPDLPRPAVAGSAVNPKTEAAPQRLSRDANALRQAAAKQEQQKEPKAAPAPAPAVKSEKAAPQIQTEPVKAAPQSEPAKPAPTAQKKQPQAAAESAVKAAPAAAPAASVKSSRAAGVVRPEQVPFSGLAIPGGSSELNYKNDAHYTLQVVAGRNRQNVVQVSAALSGRYWIYETVREGRPWYVLIVGEYPSRAGAQDALRQLPAAVRAAKPFAKSFAAVKQEMQAASEQ